MTEQQLSEIGAVLHRGAWQVSSFTRGMAEMFIDELEAIGFTVQEHPLPNGGNVSVSTIPAESK